MADAVVIGAGPNGLVAANLLADAGWDVLVLEAEPEPGGAVRSGVTTAPGYVHDRFSSFYPLVAGSKVMQSLELERHGLELRRAEAAVGHPLPGGRAALIYGDPDRTAAQLDALHPGDGDAYLGWHQRWERIGGPLLDALLSPFPPARGTARLAAALRTPAAMGEFMRLALQPVRGFAEENFGGDGPHMLFAANALHADFSPQSPGSAIYAFVLVGLAQSVGFPVSAGGSSGLTAALVRRLEAAGGQVRCGARAERIVLRGGRARAVRTADGEEHPAARAVLADVGAPQLYRDLVGYEHLPARVRTGIERFEYDPSTIKVDWALSGPVPWEASELAAAGTIHVADSLDHLTDAMADIAAHRVPDVPFLVGGQYARYDPSRQPDGTESVQFYTHVPQRIRPGEAVTGTWDDRDRETMAERMEAAIERHAPGFRERIVARTIQAPPDLEAHDANLVNGALNGGTAQLHQQLVLRPVPGLGRAGTPVPGLFLASASAHPGGGVHGACGANAARAALRGRWAGALRRPVAATR